MSSEKTDLINSILEDDTVKKLKILEKYFELNKQLQNRIDELITRQKNAVSTNNQDAIADVLNELSELKTDINILEYINAQEEIDELLLNIKLIIETNLKG